MARLIASYFLKRHVIGIDVRPEYVDFAESALATTRVRRKRRHSKRVMLALPFETARLESGGQSIYCSGFRDPRCIAEMKRVTTGGAVVPATTCAFLVGPFTNRFRP